MSRIMKITCDWCGNDITSREYQTMTFRRYAGVNHERVYRLPTMWMCDKCYKKLALKMSFPPYERKKGQWIVTSEFEDCRYVKCNQCKVTQVFYYNEPLTNFCPNCGADMRGGKE